MNALNEWLNSLYVQYKCIFIMRMKMRVCTCYICKWGCVCSHYERQRNIWVMYPWLFYRCLSLFFTVLSCPRWGLAVVASKHETFSRTVLRNMQKWTFSRTVLGTCKIGLVFLFLLSLVPRFYAMSAVSLLHNALRQYISHLHTWKDICSKDTAQERHTRQSTRGTKKRETYVEEETY